MCVPPIALLICALWHIGSVNGYIGPRQDPSSVASTQSATVTPTFSFNKISQLTTCKPAGITWIYSPITVDDALELTLFITNDGVEQLPPVATTTGTFNTPSAARAVSQRDIAQPITQQITANPVDPLVRVFTWHSVNDLPNFSNISNAFFVKNGPNISCITPTPTSSLSFTPTDHTSTASVSPSTGVPAITPGPSKHKVNRGVIVGGAVGGVAALCAAITAYLYLMRLRRRRSIPLLHTPVPPVLLRPSSPPPMRSKGATAVVVTRREVQPLAVAASTTALNAPLPGAVETPEVHHPEQQRRRDLEIEERLRHVEEQLASVSQPPACN